MRRRHLLLGLFVLAACGAEDGAMVFVDLRTDYPSGVDFDEVQVRLVEAGATTESLSTRAVTLGESFLEGRRVAEFRDVAPGTTTVNVRLLQLPAERIAERTVAFDVSETRGVTVVIARECAGVACPGGGDSRDATECLAGRCVTPRCVRATDEGCGPAVCVSDDECGSGCLRGSCADGSCLASPDDTLCVPGERCDPERGCVFDVEDGGTADGGDAGVGDAGDGGPRADAGCRAGELRCGATCVNPSDDAAHCGACDNACDALACCGGGCVDLGTDLGHCGACGLTCFGDGDCCGGVCTDVRLDEDNCGSCGGACGVGERCCAGTCASPTAPACTGCPTDCSLAGEACCDGSCVDIQSDEANCGGCGASCGAGQVCCGGACTPSGDDACGESCSSCATGDLCCLGSCVTMGPLNCGACGSTCSSPSTCCPTGCVNLQTSDANCGACGTDCTATGQQCSNGNCCPAGQTFCAGSCVDTTTSQEHCGGCGNACGVVQMCRGGSCRL